MTDTKRNDRRTLRVSAADAMSKSHDEIMARSLVSARSSNALVIHELLKAPFGEVGLTELVAELDRQAAAASRGDMANAEAMLTVQAASLNAIFTALALDASVNTTEHLEAFDRYMRLALKAQSQCRATLETLAAIKNPPMVIARQANISNGPQQVNNRIESSSHADARAREIQNAPSKLLEQTHGERLDPGTTGQAIGTDTQLEAVGAVHGTKDD